MVKANDHCKNVNMVTSQIPQVICPNTVTLDMNTKKTGAKKMHFFKKIIKAGFLITVGIMRLKSLLQVPLRRAEVVMF